MLASLTRKRHLTLVALWCGRTGGWAYGHVITKFRGYFVNRMIISSITHQELHYKSNTLK